MSHQVSLGTHQFQGRRFFQESIRSCVALAGFDLFGTLLRGRTPRRVGVLTTVGNGKQKKPTCPRDPITFWERKWRLNTLMRRWLHTPIIIWQGDWIPRVGYPFCPKISEISGPLKQLLNFLLLFLQFLPAEITIFGDLFLLGNTRWVVSVPHERPLLKEIGCFYLFSIWLGMIWILTHWNALNMIFFWELKKHTSSRKYVKETLGGHIKWRSNGPVSLHSKRYIYLTLQFRSLKLNESLNLTLPTTAP